MRPDNRNSMDRAVEPAERALEAQARELHALIAEARRQLTNPTPENLELCRCGLGRAISLMEQIQGSAPGAARSRNMAALLSGLRTQLAGVQALLDSAAEFYRGWMRIAASMVSGYAADGNPATPETGRRVLLEA